jgi:hypothetical protein
MKYQNRVLGMLALLSIITYVDRVRIAVAGPRMQEDLGISPQAWGWVTSMFFLSYSAFEIPSGLMGDRIGPRKVLTRIASPMPKQNRISSKREKLDTIPVNEVNADHHRTGWSCSRCPTSSAASPTGVGAC